MSLPEGSSPPESHPRLNVNLHKTTADAMGTLSVTEGVSLTVLVGRMASLYVLAKNVQYSGGHVLIQQSPDGPIEEIPDF